MSEHDFVRFGSVIVLALVALGITGYRWLQARRDPYEYLSKARLKDFKDRSDKELLAQPRKEFLVLLGIVSVSIVVLVSFIL
jgi:hypothetical protein